jgi:hypothetical protein
MWGGGLNPGFGVQIPHLRTQTPGLTRDSPPFYITNAGGEPRVKPWVWRPEMWAVIRVLIMAGTGST